MGVELPVYIRIGNGPEAHVGTFTISGATGDVVIQAAEMLHAVADEMRAQAETREGDG